MEAARARVAASITHRTRPYHLRAIILIYARCTPCTTSSARGIDQTKALEVMLSIYIVNCVGSTQFGGLIQRASVVVVSADFYVWCLQHCKSRGNGWCAVLYQIKSDQEKHFPEAATLNFLMVMYTVKHIKIIICPMLLHHAPLLVYMFAIGSYDFIYPIDAMVDDEWLQRVYTLDLIRSISIKAWPLTRQWVEHAPKGNVYTQKKSKTWCH